MDLEALHQMAPDDQWTFVRGRIVETSVELGAALRGLHAQLRGLDSTDALLSAPQNWTVVIDQCRTMTTCAVVSESGLRAAIGQAIDEAATAYEMRNRYMHDLLTKDVDKELVPDSSIIGERDGYFLLCLASKGGTSPIVSVTFKKAIETAKALIAATWKLRAARGYLAGQTTWRTALLGDLDGHWGGSATWTYAGPDDD